MKEDVIVLFENIAQYFERLDSKSCDKVVRSGTAQAFAKSLRDQYVFHQQSLKTPVPKTIQISRVLHISVLCKALALILRCSDSELQSPNNSIMKQHLAASVPQVAEMMLVLKDYGTLPLMTLGNAVRIMHRIAPFIDQLPSQFLKSTTPLLDERFPSTIRTDAALSVVCFLKHKSSKAHKLEMEDCNRVVSILSVSATTSVGTKMEEIMEALAALVTSSKYFAKLARRKCCILAATENLVYENKSIRRQAFGILVSIIESHELENGPAGIFASNMELIIQGLIHGAMKGSEKSMFRDVLDLLVRLVVSEKLLVGVNQNAEILNALKTMAAKEGRNGDYRTEHAATCYLRAASKHVHNVDILLHVVDLTASAYVHVRMKALGALQELVFWTPSVAKTLFLQTDFLEKVCMTIRRGTAQEQAIVMQTCKTLTFDQMNHVRFLKHGDFVSCLSNLLTSNTTKDLPTLITAMDILLDLMLTTEGNVDYFLGDRELLPWMVSLANRTLCSDLKARLISAIQRLTLRLLKESY